MELTAADYLIEAKICERNAEAAAIQGRKVEASRLEVLAKEYRTKAAALSECRP